VAALQELLHYLANWCAEEEVRLREQLKMLEAGEAKTRERRWRGGRQRDRPPMPSSTF